MRALTGRLHGFWSAERSLTTLLVALLLLMLLPGVGRVADAFLAVTSSLLLTVLLLAGALTLVRHRLLQALCWGLVVVAVVTRWGYTTGNYPLLLGPSLLATLGCLLAIAWVVVVQLSRAEAVTAHHVRGAMALYLLVAAIFGYAFAYLEVVSPGAFRMPDWWARGTSHRPETFFYFSVVTLTTLGFGDITAVDPAGRDLVMLEALIGQLFPAIILARLVTLELEARRPAAASATLPADPPPGPAGSQQSGRDAGHESGSGA